MIEIKKGREPDSLLRYRRQEGASYEEMDKSVKADLLEKLLREQGHICAYCMKRIPESRKLPAGVVPVTIEHWLPRNPESKEDIGQRLLFERIAYFSDEESKMLLNKTTCILKAINCELEQLNKELNDEQLSEEDRKSKEVYKKKLVRYKKIWQGFFSYELKANATVLSCLCT